MRVYGFNDIDVQRGELRGAEIDAELLHYDGEAEKALDWDYLSSMFATAKAKLIERMTEEEVDDEMIQVVASMKAKFIPLETID